MSSIFEKTSFSVVWKREDSLDVMQEFDDYIYITHGEVVGETEMFDGLFEKREVVASFSVTFVNFEKMIAEGQDVEDIFDSHSDAMYNYYNVLYDGHDFMEDIYEMYDYGLVGANLFIIDRLLVFSRFRGHGLGLKVMDFLISRLGHGAALVLIKPFPLQFECGECPEQWKRDPPREWGFSKLSKSKKNSMSKLRAHYGKIGFSELEGTPYMIRPSTRY